MAGTVTWRPSDDMAAWLRERAELAHADAGLSSRTRIELTMWREALAVELGRTRWSLSELGLIADVCNEPGVREGLHSPMGRIAEAVATATASAPGLYGQKWGTNEVFLIGKLTQLGPIAAAALVDAVARWWRDEVEHTVEGWASVGVTAVEGMAIFGDGSRGTLAQLGWTRQGAWSEGDPDHSACDVFARVPLPFLEDGRREELQEELRVLDRNAERLRRQLAVVNNTMRRPSDAPTTGKDGGQGDE